jgi:hypothetical protein
MAILTQAMRRFVPLVVILALALPAAAWGVKAMPGDGTLVVDNGRGYVVVRVRGGILGRFDQGRLTVDDPVKGDGSGPKVFNADQVQDLGNGRTVYIGNNIRFRMIGGLYRVQVNAVGIDISAVGRGTVTLDATGFTDFPGRFSLDGGVFQPLPGHATTYTLGQAQTTTSPPGK